MSNSATEEILHTVTGAGPAQNMAFSGRGHVSDDATRPDTPLVIAVPGGTYTARYFDTPGHSLLERAGAVGVPILAIDRPGYRDSTPVEHGESIILANAEVLNHLVGELWEKFGAGRSGVVLIGHSIGGAVVTAMAAGRPAWPLLGIAVSGCLLQVPSESRAAWDALPDIDMVELPSPMKDFVMFGPEWTYSDRMPTASHLADAPVPRAELLDITGGWINRVKSIAAEINVPVHARQGEFDKLWITDEEQVAGFGASFTASPSVDAQLVRSSGHCIDFHRAGAAFQLEQLAFALKCCIKAE